MTRDEFESVYGDPWSVEDRSLADVPSIFGLYKQLQIKSTTREALITTALKFRCFVWGNVVAQLKSMPETAIPRLHEIWQQGTQAKITQAEIEMMVDVLLPPVMLRAALLARKANIPEFYAGLQWIRATAPFEEKKDMIRMCSTAKVVYHKARGGTYNVINTVIAERAWHEGDKMPYKSGGIRMDLKIAPIYVSVQCSKRPIKVGDLIVIYRDQVTQSYYGREVSEFNDGRFEVVEP